MQIHLKYLFAQNLDFVLGTHGGHPEHSQSSQARRKKRSRRSSATDATGAVDTGAGAADTRFTGSPEELIAVESDKSFFCNISSSCILRDARKNRTSILQQLSSAKICIF